MLDRRLNVEADTGTFELAYKQVIPKAPAYLGLSLCINGKRLMHNKKSKERRHEHRSVTPPSAGAPAGDAQPHEQPVPPEYNGPIITDFLSWLNPYDSLPTDKDGILLATKDSLTVRRAVTVVKTTRTIQNRSKKRKPSAISSRTYRGRRERNVESKRRIVPHSCCRPEDGQINNNVGKYRTESASKAEKPKIDRSVGNKRCYIDPIEWERETASILRSTISVQNKISARAEAISSVKQIKSDDVGNSSSNRNVLQHLRSRVDNSSTIKKISAIGRSICKLRDENKSKKSISFSKSCTSIYAPYRVTITPLNDES